MDLSLSKKQQSAVAFGLTLVALAVSVIIILKALQAVAAFFDRFSLVFLPLFTAGVFALLLKPYHRFWVQRCRCRPGFATMAVFLSLFLPLILLLWFIGGVVFSQAAQLATSLPSLAQEFREKLENLTPSLRETLEKYQVADRARAIMQRNMDDIAKTAQEVLSGMLGKGSSAVKSLASVAAWAVMPVYLAFMLTLKISPPVSIESFLPFLKEQTRNDVAYLAREFMKILVSFFRGQFVVAVLQGLVYGTLYAAMGLKMGFVIGFLQGLFNVVPFLGTLGGIAIAIPTAMLQDGGGTALLVKWAIAFGIGQLVETYLITPRIQGESTGLHPMAIIFAVFFWGTAFQGMMGLFLAIPLTAFVVVVWRLVKTKYITEIV